MGDSEAEGAARKERSASRGQEEDEAVVRSYHDMLFSGNLRQAISQATKREGGGCLFLDDQCTNTRQPVAEFPGHASPPVENPTCAAFEEYGDVPSMVPLNFTGDCVT